VSPPPGLPGGPGARPVWAEVDRGALRHNVALLRRAAAPAALCAVVKADGYGHGALAVGRAAVGAGAAWLAVATVEEGVELRRGGIGAPVLVLAEPPPGAMAEVVARRLTPALYSAGGIEAAARAAARAGVVTDVHLKLDTGMHRVGAGPEELDALVDLLLAHPSLRFAALWTHFPVADGVGEEDRAFTAAQVAALQAAAARLRAAGRGPALLHAANSAGALAHPGARLDLVRCGIALYGVDPFPVTDATVAGVLEATGAAGLRPVLSLRAEVTHVRRHGPGTRPSYGRLRPLGGEAVVATVPLGYADGVPRRFFSAGGTVLVRGRRRALAGMVTMDQIVLDCGQDGDVVAGDEVVLIGPQGADEVSATEWAGVLGTIPHEVLCGIGKRVPRVVVDAGAPSGAREGAS